MNNHYVGEQVTVFENNNFVFAGIITKMGSVNASINDYKTNNTYEVSYPFIHTGISTGMHTASVTKTAQAEIINETDKNDKKFLLVKNEKNIDGTLSVAYEVKVDDKMIWESEEIITNVYDVENGWSAPDDFDDNKLDLIQQSAESGFDMVVDSYTNIVNMVDEAQAVPEELSEEVPVGEPAFAADPNTSDAEGGGGGGGGATLLNTPEGEEGALVGEDGTAGDVIEDPDSDVGGPEAFGQDLSVETSLEAQAQVPSFARSILGSVAKEAIDHDPSDPIYEDYDWLGVISNQIPQNIMLEDSSIDEGYLLTMKDAPNLYITLSFNFDNNTYNLWFNPNNGAVVENIYTSEDIDTVFNYFLDIYTDDEQLADFLTEIAEDTKQKKQAGKDNRLHGNPEHRLNPAVRKEMDARNIDSGSTNDIELSEELKDFDYSL